jgi:hypothetical protein
MHTLPASKSHRLFKYKQFPFFRTIACVYVYVYAQFQPELDFLQVAALSLHGKCVRYLHRWIPSFLSFEFIGSLKTSSFVSCVRVRKNVRYDGNIKQVCYRLDSSFFWRLDAGVVSYGFSGERVKKKNYFSWISWKDAALCYVQQENSLRIAYTCDAKGILVLEFVDQIWRKTSRNEKKWNEKNNSSPISSITQCICVFYGMYGNDFLE